MFNNTSLQAPATSSKQWEVNGRLSINFPYEIEISAIPKYTEARHFLPFAKPYEARKKKKKKRTWESLTSHTRNVVAKESKKTRREWKP